MYSNCKYYVHLIFRFWSVNVNVFHYWFRGVPDRPPFLTVHRSWPFSWTFHVRPFVTFLRPEKLRNYHETFWNGLERWAFRNGEWTWTLDGLKRWYCTTFNGLKRSHFKNKRSTVLISNKNHLRTNSLNPIVQSSNRTIGTISSFPKQLWFILFSILNTRSFIPI